MSDEVSLAELLDQWRAGDQQAARAIYQRYESRILRFAQPNINPKFHPRFDAEDIMATVLRTVLGRIHQGQYSVDSKGSIWKLIRQVTLNKIRKYAERHDAAKRAVGKEAKGENAELLLQRVLQQELSPEELAAFADELDDIRGKLKPESFEILDLLLQGYTKREIADRLDSCYHAVAPKVQWLKEWLVRRGEQGE